MKYIIVPLALLFYGNSYAQKIDRNWKSKLDESVTQFKDCKNTVEAGVSSCNKYIGETLQSLYHLSDFYSTERGRYMLAGEIHNYVQNSARWIYLGKGYEQKALTKAQQRANERKAVVAVYRNAAAEGHVAYILPGELQASGSWNLQVPNSAAYFIDQPERSYSQKGLSYSFSRNLLVSVDLYVKK